jgi:hypothetical protein
MPLRSVLPLRLTAPLALLTIALGLAGCISNQPSTRIPAAALPGGVVLERSLPEKLPKRSSPFPHSQFVLLAGENPLGLASPIPFVAEFATDVLHQSRAEKWEARYRDVHPYLITVETFSGSPLLGRTGAAFTLRPFVFLQDGADDVFRLDLVFDVSGPGWNGRYHYHLPTTLTAEEASQPSPRTLAALNAELRRGASLLRTVIERDARGELADTGRKADLGSLHLVGQGSYGLVPANLILARDAEILEETDGHVLVRIIGDPTQATSAGGLFFGVHWFTPDQLHTLKRR